MGIDIYARARREKEEKENLPYDQKYCGKNGYLRESYHGGPYVTKFFVEEGFDHDSFTEKDENDEHLGAQIPASVLRERLPIAVMLSAYRSHKLYGEGSNPGVFEVELEGGEGAKKFASVMAGIFADMGDNTHRFLAGQVDEATQAKVAKAIENDEVQNQSAQQYIDFVEFCEQIEKETGEPAFIYSSY